MPNLHTVERTGPALDETTHPSPGDAELRHRIVGVIHPCGDSAVVVAHLYEPEGTSGQCECDDCENDAHDPGMVDLFVEHGEDDVSVQMFPAMALELANRLTRTANLILESLEDVPDVEREAARFSRREKP